MTNTFFRKKTFKGAKIEDLIEQIDAQLLLLEKKQDNTYYQGMCDALDQTKLQLIHAFKYEYVEEET